MAKLHDNGVGGNNEHLRSLPGFSTALRINLYGGRIYNLIVCQHISNTYHLIACVLFTSMITYLMTKDMLMGCTISFKERENVVDQVPFQHGNRGFFQYS